MTNTGKNKNVKSYNVKAELKKVNKLFADLSKDKSLPTFPQFFVDCVILGIEERVNLRIMYPKVYTKVRRQLDEQNAAIRAIRKA
jgi:hypothetical protein